MLLVYLNLPKSKFYSCWKIMGKALELLHIAKGRKFVGIKHAITFNSSDTG